MGYFSKLTVFEQEKCRDSSYHGVEDQLQWRLEELKARYRSLWRTGAPWSKEDHFSQQDYRYAPIQSFKALFDVSSAIEVAEEELKERYGLVVDEDGTVRYIGDEESEQDEEQVSIVEIVYLPSWFQTLAAA